MRFILAIITALVMASCITGTLNNVVQVKDKAGNTYACTSIVDFKEGQVITDDKCRFYIRQEGKLFECEIALANVGKEFSLTENCKAVID